MLRLKRWSLGIAALLIMVMGLAGCTVLTSLYASEFVPGGDAERGAHLIDYYGCDACHTIPGIRSPRATVGPPLYQWPERAYIAGVMPNTQDNLVRWLMSPQSISPSTAMPDLGLTEAEARDISAYLLTRR
jgi:cytochrome c2